MLKMTIQLTMGKFIMKFFWLIFILIEALVLYYGYNFFASEFNTLGYFKIPEKVNYLFIVGIFIIIHYVGFFIKDLFFQIFTKEDIKIK